MSVVMALSLVCSSGSLPPVWSDFLGGGNECAMAPVSACTNLRHSQDRRASTKR